MYKKSVAFNKLAKYKYFHKINIEKKLPFSSTISCGLLQLVGAFFCDLSTVTVTDHVE